MQQPADYAIPRLDPEAVFENSAWMRGLARTLVLSDERADDVVQEAWRAALESPPRRDVPLRAWLAGVVRNQALFLKRSEGRRAGREADAARPERVTSTADLAACADEQRVLLDAVLALPEPYRDVVLLRFYEGLEPRYIAARLDAPVNTVRTRLQRALERLRERLDDHHEGDRRAWGLALLPLARVDASALGLSAAAATTTLGVFVMSLKVIAAAAVAVLIGVGVWSLSREEVPDLSRRTSAAEAAEELFGARDRARDVAVSTGEREVVADAAPREAARMLRGRVVDTSGAPIEDARIWLEREPSPNTYRPVSRRVEMAGWAQSDADGRFARELAPDREQPWLSVVHADYLAVAELVETRTGEEAVLVMAPLARTRLAVEVVDATTGQRVPRFRVMASVPLENPVGGPTAMWTSLSHDSCAPSGAGAESGAASAVGVVPEFDVEFALGRPLSLLIDAPGLTAASDRTSFRRTLEPNEVVANGRTTVRFTLDLDAPERGAPHRVALGRVVDDATGEPIAGAEVVGVSDVLAPAGAEEGAGTSGGPRRVTTFADGRFRIALVEPPSTVWAHHPRYASAHATHDGAGEIELRLTRRGSLRGVLVDREGAPLANAPLLLLQAESTPRVSTFETDDRHVRATTDTEGRFAFEYLRPSRYHLCAMRGPKDPDEKALARETVQLEAGEDRELVFRLEPPERVIVYGTVTGSELAGSRANEATPHLVPTFLPYAAEGAWTQAEPTATGYRAGGLERGRYLVLLAPANDDVDGPYALIPDVEITAFGEQRLDLRFPTGSLSGRVVLDEPREGLVVTAVPVVPEGFAREVLAAGKPARSLGVVVGEDGGFEVRGLAEGVCRVELRDGLSNDLIASRTVSIAGSTEIGIWRD